MPAEELRVSEYPEESIVKMVFLDYEPWHFPAIEKMLFDDFRYVVDLDVAVHYISRIDYHNRAFCAHPQAAGQVYPDSVGQRVLL